MWFGNTEKTFTSFLLKGKQKRLLWTECVPSTTSKFIYGSPIPSVFGIRAYKQVTEVTRVGLNPSWLIRCHYGLPGWFSGQESSCQCRRRKRCSFSPWVGKIPWHTKWQPAPVFLPGKFHGQRNLAGYHPRGHRESATTAHAHIYPYKRKTHQRSLPACTEERPGAFTARRWMTANQEERPQQKWTLLASWSRTFSL